MSFEKNKKRFTKIEVELYEQKFKEYCMSSAIKPSKEIIRVTKMQQLLKGAGLDNKIISRIIVMAAEV